jgi:rubredoxin
MFIYKIIDTICWWIFGGEKGTNECKNLMLQFEQICSEIGVPVANEKTEGPSTIIEYLGLAIDTVNMLIKIPEKKNI